LISGNISIAVFSKNKREKMGRKKKGHKKYYKVREKQNVYDFSPHFVIYFESL